MKRFIYVLTAIVLMMSNVAAFGTSIEEKTEQNQLIEDMILYYGCYGEAADEEINWLLGALKKTDIRQGKLWEEIMDYWGYVNTGLAINKDSLPGNLPGNDSLALVILGQGLNADGSMKDELIRRLKVGLDCSEQYPNAYVVCTGGGDGKRE